VARLIPKVLGNFESATGDSYMDGILGTPCYTKPAVYQGLDVPEPLQSGNHKQIREFRRLEAIKKCLANRPELLKEAELTDDERDFVQKHDKNSNSTNRS